jgi:hypothetical protein
LSGKAENIVHLELILNVLGADFLKKKHLDFLKSNDLLSSVKLEK